MCVHLGTAAHSSAAAACLPHFISYTAQWVTLVLAAGSCPVSFVRGMLCQRHRALLIYDSTIITSRREQFMFTDDSRRPAVMGVWIFKKSSVLTHLSSHIPVFHLFVCRNTQISHKGLKSMHTPSVAQVPLASFYRATYAVQQSPQKRSRVWVLLFK